MTVTCFAGAVMLGKRYLIQANIVLPSMGWSISITITISASHPWVVVTDHITPPRDIQHAHLISSLLAHVCRIDGELTLLIPLDCMIMSIWIWRCICHNSMRRQGIANFPWCPLFKSTWIYIPGHLKGCGDEVHVFTRNYRSKYICYLCISSISWAIYIMFVGTTTPWISTPRSCCICDIY